MAADPDSRVKDVLDDILTLVGSGPTGLDGRLDALEYMIAADRLTTGQETVSRLNAVSNAVSLSASQAMRLSYFTGRKSETSTQVRIYTGATAAGATPTLARVGLYTIAANGGGTLVASTANDTALFATLNTAYTKAWSAPYAMVAGQRYALGVLVVTAAALPTFQGALPFPGAAAELMVAEVLTANLTGQADLPASFASGSLAISGSRIYAAILP